MASEVADVANSLSSVPVIGPVASVVGTAASAVSSVLDWFGFTRQNAQSNLTNVSIKSVTNVANINCDDNNDVAALFADNALSIDPTIGGGCSEDELSFESFFNHWTLYKYFDWSTEDSAGSILGSIPVTPMVGVTNDTTIVYLGPAGFTGLLFAYWRGTMEYRIVIPVSKFHRGILQVFWVPEYQSVPAGDVTNIAFNVIYDVTACEETQIKVGYAKAAPFAETRLITELS